MLVHYPKLSEILFPRILILVRISSKPLNADSVLLPQAYCQKSKKEEQYKYTHTRFLHTCRNCSLKKVRNKYAFNFICFTYPYSVKQRIFSCNRENCSMEGRVLFE